MLCCMGHPDEIRKQIAAAEKQMADAMQGSTESRQKAERDVCRSCVVKTLID